MNNRAAVVFLVLCLVAAARCAQVQPDPIHIARASGPITIDGNLTEEAWKNAQPITKWYETNPGDNIEPRVKSVAWLAYDEKFFYAAFEFQDPEPKKITASYNDHDRISGN